MFITTVKEKVTRVCYNSPECVSLTNIFREAGRAMACVDFVTFCKFCLLESNDFGFFLCEMQMDEMCLVMCRAWGTDGKWEFMVDKKKMVG